MTPKATNIQQTAVYGSEKVTRQQLIIAVFVCAVRAAGIYTARRSSSTGPPWGETFLPKGESVQIALHPDLMPAKSPQIRQAVEARWRAFGDPRRTGRVRPS